MLLLFVIINIDEIKTLCEVGRLLNYFYLTFVKYISLIDACGSYHSFKRHKVEVAAAKLVRKHYV